MIYCTVCTSVLLNNKHLNTELLPKQSYTSTSLTTFSLTGLQETLKNIMMIS